MSNEVQFDDNRFNMNTTTTSTKQGMTGWLVRHGWAKDPRGAEMALISVALILLVIAAFLGFRSVMGTQGVPKGFEGNAPSIVNESSD